jgi:hypothetical protein
MVEAPAVTTIQSAMSTLVEFFGAESGFEVPLLEQDDVGHVGVGVLGWARQLRHVLRHDRLRERERRGQRHQLEHRLALADRHLERLGDPSVVPDLDPLAELHERVQRGRPGLPSSGLAAQSGRRQVVRPREGRLRGGLGGRRRSLRLLEASCSRRGIELRRRGRLDLPVPYGSTSRERQGRSGERLVGANLGLERVIGLLLGAHRGDDWGHRRLADQGPQVLGRAPTLVGARRIGFCCAGAGTGQ